MNKHGNKARLAITINRELVKQLEQIAELRGASISSLVEQCVVERIGTLEMVSRMRNDPFVDRVVSELLKPENLQRARDIVGEVENIEPDLIALREKAIGSSKEKGRVK